MRRTGAGVLEFKRRSVLRLIDEGANPAPAALQQPSAAEAAPSPAPDWLWRPIDLDAEPGAPIHPSSALAAADRWRDAALTPARRDALRTGALTHILLQYLPDLPFAARARAGLAYLDARAPDLDPPARQRLLEAALGVIDSPDLSPLFGPQSKAEVAIAGQVALPRGGLIGVAGRIDRLGLTPGAILAADFKTGAPCAPADVPARYLAQMALYRAVLAPLCPGRRPRMLLIWTDGPVVVALEDERLDAALAAIEPGGETGKRLGDDAA